jgi:DNA-binding NtrC family response regulator
MCRTFLVIGDREEFLSSPNILSALKALGEVTVLPPPEALRQILLSKYDLVIIDATMLDSEMLLLSQIREMQPDVRLLVLTASPTWRRARDVLKAGAMDYMSKALSEKEYLDAFQELLNRTPLP